MFHFHKFINEGLLSATNLESDRIKIKLVFNLSIIYFIVLVLPIPIYISIIDRVQLFVSLFGILGPISTIFVLRYKKSYFTASIVYCIIGFLSNFLSILVYGNGKLDLVMFPWFIAHALFAFLTIGKKFGVGMLLATLGVAFLVNNTSFISLFTPFLNSLPSNSYDVFFSIFLVFLFIYLVIEKFILIHNSAILSLQNENILQSKIGELNSKNEIALQSAKMKAQFFANMSHEIRTPMNSIIGFSNLLLKGDNLSEKQQRFLDAISINSKNLLHIINDVLDFSKIESGKLELSYYSFSLQNAIRKLEKSMSFLTQEKQIQLVSYLDANIPNEVVGDEVRIIQIFTNLLSNAIKFSSNSEIIIRIDIQKELEDKFVLACSVQDFGKGMTSEECEKIFESFYQVKNIGGVKQTGTGLGLAIVKQLVTKMNGTINAESEVGKGTTFYFQIEVGNLG
jgi:signal transduction histidine kinase